jgi:alditol oxidase
LGLIGPLGIGRRIPDTMRNWAGNVTYRAARLHEPTTVGDVQAIVRSSTRVRALGTRHSFNDIADTDGDLVSLARLPRRVEIDKDRRTVTVDGGIRFSELFDPLDAAGFALHTLASLPHLSVAGAVATATHGSGVGRRNLSSAVVAMDLVGGNGDLVRLERGSDDTATAGAAVSLGALGVVTALTLAVEPTYDMRQDVYESMPVDAFRANFDEIVAAAESVSCFTTWRGEAIDQVWVKSRVEPDRSVDLADEWFGARRATRDLHPIPGLPPDACNPQVGRVGRWHERLPHFRADRTPSAGDELQAEYFVARADAIAAFDALWALRDELAPLVQVSEIRTIAADELWLSPAYRRDSVAFHFTWQPDRVAVDAMLRRVEAALAPFEPRPHWGKLFGLPPDELRARYERLDDFVALADRLDPAGRFRNAFVDHWIREGG